jgi:Tfp pilus assembly protein PilV
MALERRLHAHPDRGASMVELMVALVVLALGILAVGQLFPAGSQSQVRGKLMTSANLYAQQKIEQLRPLSFNDAALDIGRHPAGIATESLGDHGTWQRFYNVEQMAQPLQDMKKITVTVTWTYSGSRTATATTYVRR